MTQDYVVAIDIKEDTVQGSWAGEKYSNKWNGVTDDVHQFQVSGCKSKAEAHERAFRIHNLLKASS